MQALKSCCYELELQCYLLHLLQRLFVIRRAAAWSQWFSSCLVMPPTALKGHSALLHRGALSALVPWGFQSPSAPGEFPSNIHIFLPAQCHRLISETKQNWKKGMFGFCIPRVLYLFLCYVAEGTGIFIALLYTFQ